MLKHRPEIAAFFAAALVVFPQMADSRPLFETSSYPVVSNSPVSNLTCYMETQEGATLNLGRLCGEIDPTNSTVNVDSSTSLSGNSRGVDEISSTEDEFDCSDFATQAEAQQVLKAVPDDPNGLGLMGTVTELPDRHYLNRNNATKTA